MHTADPIVKPKSPWRPVAAIFGAVIGFYCGLTLLIPIALSFGALAALKNVDAPRLGPFKVAASVVIAHAAWMSAGFFVKDLPMVMFVPDIVLMVIGLIWLFASPGRGSVWYFTILEGVSALINLLSFVQQSFGSAGNKALVAHLCLRVFVIASLWIGLRSTTAKPPPLPGASPVLPD